VPASEDKRRTRLASERTQLAWWRTGLAALAVALGVGRVVPDLSTTSSKLPYTVAGVGFALWGIAALAYGSLQRAQVERAIDEDQLREPSQLPLVALTLAGAALGLLTAVLILID